MQELHTKTGTFSKGWLVVAKITENTRRHDKIVKEQAVM